MKRLMGLVMIRLLLLLSGRSWEPRSSGMTVVK